jgi:aspartokinase/homoserine dehydrogenase 1
MKVLKFGGTSVGSEKNIRQVISILNDYSEKDNVIAVVSAVGGITNKLLKAGELAKIQNLEYVSIYEEIHSKHIELIKALIPKNNDEIINDTISKLQSLKQLLDGIYLIHEISPSTSDKLCSYGELLSSQIIAEAMKYQNLDAQVKNSQELIVTDDTHTKAEVNYALTNKNIKYFFKSTSHKITILPGFISKSENGAITTLGRGGSDFTAAIVAAALKVSDLEIWTDVSGMFSANPKVVKNAHPIESISYFEAMELSHFGAKVLYPPTVQPVLDLEIPIYIKNTLNPSDYGTLISKETGQTKNPVKGISHVGDISLLTLEGNGMVGIPGFAKRLFETLAQEKINVILITQASSEHSICFGVNTADALRAKDAIDLSFENEIELGKINPIKVENELSIVALVGDNMKNHQGISGKMFSTLGKNNINIRAIAQGASEKNISAVINKNDVKKALNSLHEIFFEGDIKQLNVFITGVGNVGERLVEQIRKQQQYLKTNLKINLRITGISNSRTMIFNPQGIDLNHWKEELPQGEKANLDVFYETVKTFNLRNSIFVDITANEDVAKVYGKYLKESVAVVACNKIACSSKYKQYNSLKALSRQYNAPFLFETNVGAGLPVIDTLNNLISSGDKVTSIQAVLSGSLNFIFNNFNNTSKFYEIVQRAQDEGYTEPDPRIDLSGVDVARKILILARESGVTIDLEDIANESFLTQNNLSAGSVTDFYASLTSDEMHFQNLFNDAKSKNSKLKYVAEFSEGKAKVGLKQIPSNHPFYNLEGKDNIVMFYTERYKDQPLIVKGAGAGAEVTASGLFSDIIRVGNK